MPVYFLRFEDLIAEQRKTLEGLFEFLLGIESL